MKSLQGAEAKGGVSACPQSFDMGALASSPLLQKLPDSVLMLLWNARTVRHLQGGELLVADEARVEQAWLVVSGQAAPIKAQGHSGLGVASAGAVIDEVAVVLGGTHEASWVALGDVSLFGFPIEVFRSIESAHAETWDELVDHANTQMLANALRSALRLSLPSTDPEPMMERAFSQGLWWHMARGECLFSHGDELDAWYVLVSGELAETSAGLGEARIHATLRAGDLVGDCAMLAGQAYTSTVVARRDAWLLRLDAADFELLVLSQPLTVQQVARRAIDRAGTQRKNGGLDATVAVLPGGVGQMKPAFLAGLLTQLQTLGELAVLDAATCEAKGIVRNVSSLARADLAWIRLEAWTDAQHQRGRRVVFLCDEQDTAWNLHAARAADRVLLVVDGDQSGRSFAPAAWRAVVADKAPATGPGHDPGPTHVQRWQPQNWLCLTHAADCKRPQGTAGWLDALSPSRHFHVRPERATDMARLARHLAGQAVGLALSGGGGRGPAHAGVFKALEEQRVPIDFVAGTSAGALMACLFAQDEGWQSCAKRAIEGIGPAPGPFSDLTLPVVSLIKSQRLHDLVRNTYGTERLEDSWIPCATVATNLTKLCRVVFTRGESWQVTLAGISPPGVAKPRVIAGDLICDGGLIDNMPVSVLLEHDCRHVISVNISTDQTLKLDGEDFPSPWSILFDRIARGGARTARVPTSIDILLAATTLASEDARAVAAGWTDLQISPDLKRFKPTDFMRGPELVQQGYHDAQAALTTYAKLRGRDALWTLVSRYQTSVPAPLSRCADFLTPST